MSWFLYNNNSKRVSFMEHLDWWVHVIIFMWKAYTCFSKMFRFLRNAVVRVLLCFRPIFVWTFTCLSIDVLQLFLIFWRISIFFLFVRKIYFLTYFIPMLSLCRNQPIDLNCLLMACLLYNGNTWLNWVKKKVSGCLHKTTPTWKPYLISGICFFSPKTQAWKFSSYSHSVLMVHFLLHIWRT